MRVTLLAYGSRGDVQPYLALAVGLRKAGHEVKLAAPHRFSQWVQDHNVPFISLEGDPEIISQRLNEAGQNPFGMVKAMMSYVTSIADKVISQIYSACEDTDIIIHSFLFTTGGHSIARMLNIPDISLQTFPVFVPTKEIAPVFLPKIKVGFLRFFFHWLAKEVFWCLGNAGYRKLLREHPDLPDIKLHWPFADEKNFQKSPMIYAFSSKIIPLPVEWKKEYIHVPGYLFLDTAQDQIPTEIVTFLDQDDAPICISFGSMVHKSLPDIIQKILQACKEMELRVVVLSGWEEYPSLASDRNVLIAKEAPHEILLPKCSMMIHHGGAGTTAAALRSGVPNLVIPFGADQLFWGMQVNRVGAGPAPIPEREVTIEKIKQAIEFSQTIWCKESALNISRHILEENGIEEIVKIIEQYNK